MEFLGHLKLDLFKILLFSIVNKLSTDISVWYIVVSKHKNERWYFHIQAEVAAAEKKTMTVFRHNKPWQTYFLRRNGVISPFSPFLLYYSLTLPRQFDIKNGVPEILLL